MKDSDESGIESFIHREVHSTAVAFQNNSEPKAIISKVQIIRKSDSMPMKVFPRSRNEGSKLDIILRELRALRQSHEEQAKTISEMSFQLAQLQQPPCRCQLADAAESVETEELPIAERLNHDMELEDYVEQSKDLTFSFRVSTLAEMEEIEDRIQSEPVDSKYLKELKRVFKEGKSCKMKSFQTWFSDDVIDGYTLNRGSQSLRKSYRDSRIMTLIFDQWADKDFFRDDYHELLKTVFGKHRSRTK